MSDLEEAGTQVPPQGVLTRTTKTLQRLRPQRPEVRGQGRVAGRVRREA